MKNLSKESLNKPPIASQEEPKIKNRTSDVKNSQTLKIGDISHIYTYALSCTKQKETINLKKHHTQLEKIIKAFFGEALKSLVIQQDSYILELKEAFDIGAKRRLGRLISQGSNLKEHVNTILYNGKKDTSGQLFRLIKESKNEK